MKFAIIGGGVAAFEAATAIRERDPEAEIVLYSKENVPPYRRPALSGMIAEPVPDARFFLKPATFYDENKITLRLGVTVESIDRAGKLLQLSNGERAAYDRLLLATGSHCFLPPVPGMELPGVLSLREFADLEEIRRRIDSGIRRVAVIGGGILGLELAESLLARNCHVTVIENSPVLLPRNLDAETAQTVSAMLGKIDRLTLRFGESVQSITPGAASGNWRLQLPGGDIEAELILVSAGTRVNLEVASQSGLACGRGIKVDAFCRTADPAVSAAGDCAEIDGSVYGLYNAAKTMGRIAGINLAGGAEPFVLNAYPARLVVFGIKIFSAGTLSGRAEIDGDPAAGNFQKRFYSEDGRLTGCILIGDMKPATALLAQLEGK